MSEQGERITAAEEKRLLRAELRRVLQHISPTQRESSSAEICKLLMQLPEYTRAKTVFCFVPMPTETDTTPVLQNALSQNKRLCVPLCIAQGQMQARAINNLNALCPGAYGISEPAADTPVVQPAEIDFAVIPCLSCNSAGKRLGRGGGYYDRFLQAFRGVSVAVCPEQCLRENIPMEVHDSYVDIVVTETTVYRVCKQNTVQ